MEIGLKTAKRNICVFRNTLKGNNIRGPIHKKEGLESQKRNGRLKVGSRERERTKAQ